MADSAMLRGTIGLALAVALLWSGIGVADTAWSLHSAAATATEDLHPTGGTLLEETGFGPWRLQRVRVTGGTYLEIAPLPPDVDTGEFHLVLVADLGSVDVARFDGVPPDPTAWIPFGLLAFVLLGAATGVAALSFGRVGVAIFGHRDPEARDITWVPGAGTHGGGGGQVPPYVPYNRDWDPKNRIP